MDVADQHGPLARHGAQRRARAQPRTQSRHSRRRPRATNSTPAAPPSDRTPPDTGASRSIRLPRRVYVPRPWLPAVLAPFSAQDRFDPAVPSRELIGGTNTKGSREEGGTKAHKDLPPYPNRAPADVPTPCKLASNDLAEQKYALVLSPLPARDEGELHRDVGSVLLAIFAKVPRRAADLRGHRRPLRCAIRTPQRRSNRHSPPPLRTSSGSTGACSSMSKAGCPKSSNGGCPGARRSLR